MLPPVGHRRRHVQTYAHTHALFARSHTIQLQIDYEDQQNISNKNTNELSDNSRWSISLCASRSRTCVRSNVISRMSRDAEDAETLADESNVTRPRRSSEYNYHRSRTVPICTCGTAAHTFHTARQALTHEHTHIAGGRAHVHQSSSQTQPVRQQRHTQNKLRGHKITID